MNKPQRTSALTFLAGVLLGALAASVVVKRTSPAGPNAERTSSPASEAPGPQTSGTRLTEVGPSTAPAAQSSVAPEREELHAEAPELEPAPTGTGTITGAARLVEGDPVPGATIVLDLAAEPEPRGARLRGTSRLGRAYEHYSRGPLDEQIAELTASHRRADQRRRVAQTDRFGRFSFTNLPPGKHRLNAYVEGVTFSGINEAPDAEVTLLGRTVHTFEFNLRLEDGTVPELAALVIDPDGDSLPSFYRWTPDQRTLRTTERSFIVEARAGARLGRRSKKPIVEWASEHVPVDLDTGLSRDVVLLPQQLLEVKLTSTQEEEDSWRPWIGVLPASAASGEPFDRTSNQVVTSSAGSPWTRDFHGLAPGAYVVGIGREEAADVLVTSQIVVGAGLTEVVIELPPRDPNEHLIVRCTDATGEPLRAAVLGRDCWYRDGGYRGGYVEAQELEPGEYWIPHSELTGERRGLEDIERLLIWARREGLGERKVDVAPGASEAIISFAATASLTIRVEGPWRAGEKVALRAALREGEEPRVYALKTQRVIPKDGRVTFELLQPGLYEALLLAPSADDLVFNDDQDLRTRTWVRVSAGDNAAVLTAP